MLIVLKNLKGTVGAEALVRQNCKKNIAQKKPFNSKQGTTHKKGNTGKSDNSGKRGKRENK